jgi:hypothetical protein
MSFKNNRNDKTTEQKIIENGIFLQSKTGSDRLSKDEDLKTFSELRGNTLLVYLCLVRNGRSDRAQPFLFPLIPLNMVRLEEL